MAGVSESPILVGQVLFPAYIFVQFSLGELLPTPGPSWFLYLDYVFPQIHPPTAPSDFGDSNALMQFWVQYPPKSK